MTGKVIKLNKIVRRYTKSSKFSYFTGTDEQLIALVEQNFPLRKDGEFPKTLVVRVPVSVDGASVFYTNIIKIKSSSSLMRSAFCKRNEKENIFRISTTVFQKKQPAKSAEVVLWATSLLNERAKATHVNSDYEIIAIKAYPDEIPSPKHPYDLLRFYESNPSEFCKIFSHADIMRSIDYWSQHAYCRNPEKKSLLDTVSPDIIELLINGDKISAVKLYRNNTGCDIAYAKKEMEKILEQLANEGSLNS